MPDQVPLSTLLSWAWVAHTIEVDNLVEARATERVARLFRLSLAMWANGLRVLEDHGTTVGELRARTRAGCNLGGLERWGWLEVVSDDGPGRRPGFGSSRGITQTTVVRPTRAGRYARRIWPQALGDVEARWRRRFGDTVVDDLRTALVGALSRAPGAMPWAPPEVHSPDGFRTHVLAGPADAELVDRPVGVLLGQVLTARTLALEEQACVSLPLGANVLRVAGCGTVPERELPRRTGTSKEAVAMAVGHLRRSGLARAGTTRAVALTGAGSQALDDYLHRAADDPDPGLRAALEAVTARVDALAEGLRPPDGGWRAGAPHASQTRRLITDPTGSLPWQPMVLHRGGWPDGS